MDFLEPGHKFESQQGSKEYEEGLLDGLFVTLEALGLDGMEMKLLPFMDRYMEKAGKRSFLDVTLGAPDCPFTPDEQTRLREVVINSLKD